MQNDFCPGGALPVKDGDKVVRPLNKTIRAFRTRGIPIFYTRDWHPRNHISFRKRGGPWPPHCIRGTKGARFHPSLDVPRGSVVFSKGSVPDKEAYSGFQGTELGKRLKSLGVQEVVIGGLTAEYCVRESVHDARSLGLAVTVLKDCVRGVEQNPGDSEKAFDDMTKDGARLVTSSEEIAQLSRRPVGRRAAVESSS